MAEGVGAVGGGGSAESLPDGEEPGGPPEPRLQQRRQVLDEHPRARGVGLEQHADTEDHPDAAEDDEPGAAVSVPSRDPVEEHHVSLASSDSSEAQQAKVT